MPDKNDNGTEAGKTVEQAEKTFEAEAPEQASENGFPAERLFPDDVLNHARTFSESLFGDPALVKDFFRPYVYLDRGALTAAGLDPTKNRLRVLEMIGNNLFPVSANHILERISTGARAAFYGPAPNEHHGAHPHFYATKYGGMDCLMPETVAVAFSGFQKNFPGRIDKVEMRLDGIGKNGLHAVNSGSRNQ